MTQEQVRALLVASLPPGARELYGLDDRGSDPAKFVDALAAAVKTHGLDQLDALRVDLLPLTTVNLIPEWEKALGFEGSKVARFGSDEARRAQITARLREFGASTIPNITAALAAVTGNTASIEILEHDRATLTNANTYTNATGALVAGGGSISQTVTAADNAPASQAGARLSFNGLTASDINDLVITLTGPDATIKTWSLPAGSNEMRSVNVADPLTFFVPEFAGLTCNGTWSLDVSSMAGDFAFDFWTLFVEGIGRNALSGAEGLGANIFEWAARIDPALADPATFDDGGVAMCRSIVQRFNPSHCRGYLCMKATTGGDSAVFDDSNTPFEQGTFA